MAASLGNTVFSWTSNSSSPYDISQALPASIEVDDVLVAYTFYAWNQNDRVCVTPSGWTQLDTVRVNGSALAGRYIFIRVATGSDTDPMTFDWDAFTGATGVMLFVLKGVDPSTVIDAANYNATGTDGAPVAGSATPSGSGAIALALWCGDDNDLTTDTGYPSGWTGIYMEETTLGGDAMMGAAYKIVSAASGAAAFSTDTSTEEWIADMLVFAEETAADVSIVPPAANLQLSTAAPTILTPVGITIPAANLQLSTTAPQINFGLSITPPAANLQLTTTAPTVAVTENVSIEIPAAQLQLSTTAPAIETPIGIEIPAADLQLSTSAPTVLFGFTISPPAAQLALSTAIPIVVAQENVSIEIPAAQLQLSTTAPDIETPIGIEIPAGNLQLSTTAPFLNFGFSLEIPAGNLQLSTTAPIVAVSENVSIEIPAAQLVLSTAAPSVSLPVGIEPPAADLQLSTAAPTVVVEGAGNVSLEIPAAQLALSTTVPTVQAGANVEIEIPAAQLQISTSAADLVLALIRQPPAAQIQITTSAPTVVLNIEIEPPAAQLSLSATAPTFEVAGPVALEIPAAQLALTTFLPIVDISIPSDIGKATVYCYLLLENGDLLAFEDTTQPGRLLLEDSIVSSITDSLTMNLPVDLMLFTPVEVEEKPK